MSPNNIKNKEEKKSVFDQFTGLYSLSKTLRFELRPVGNTEQMLEDTKIFKKDELRHNQYNEIKIYFDKLHREFVNEALYGIDESFGKDFQKYAQEYLGFKRISKTDSDYKTHKDNLKEIEDNLKKRILDLFNKKGSEFKKQYTFLKKDGVEVLFEEGVLEILKDRYGEEVEKKIDPKTKQEIVIFDLFKGFFTYLDKFRETRRNLYKIDIPTAHPVRLIDQNLRRYSDNYQIIKDRYSEHQFFPEEKLSFFEPVNYGGYLTQVGIDEYNKLVGEVNSSLNEFRQKQTDKNIKLPKIKKLDKQILSEIEKEENELSKDNFFSELNRFVLDTESRIKFADLLFKKLFKEDTEFDIKKVFIAKKSLNTLLFRYFNADSRFRLEQEVAKLNGAKKDKENKYTLNGDFFSLDTFRVALLEFSEEEEIFKDYKSEVKKSNWQIFCELFLNEIDILLSEYEDNKNQINSVIEEGAFPNGTSEKEKVAKNKTQAYLDSVRNLSAIFHYVAIEKKRIWQDDLIHDDLFYGEYKTGFYDENNIVRFYNQTRNLLSQREWSEEKWLLNFESGNLLNGWPDSPKGNTQYKSFIFRKDDNYYLGITDHSRLFDSDKYPQAYQMDDNFYEKMVYKQLDGKTIYGSIYMGKFGTKYSDDKILLSFNEMIERVKNILLSKQEDFSELKSIIKRINLGEYKTLNEIAVDISNLSLYKINFEKVSGNYVELGIYKNSKDKENHLFLFKILNKDFKSKNTLNKNIHTLYFESLFTKGESVSNIKLDGGAEIFFRPKSIEAVIDKDRKTKNEIINKKRYTEDKIFFHVPITLNRVSQNIKYVTQLNKEINKQLAKNIDDVCVIGIDRGEKHLLYYSLINSKGEIIKQESLNIVNKINYYDLLYKAEKERQIDRRSWNSARKIKDLKKGYVGHVVKELVDLVIKYNAVIVFENLNMRFKQIRSGVERSVYMQIEKALINKLNYLTLKDRTSTEIGGIANGYQLAPKIEKEADKNNQVGIILYTTAEYTSTTDPVTGFRKNIYLPNSITKEKALEALHKFDSISWDDEKGSYYFEYRSSEFSSLPKNKQVESANKIWRVYADVSRIKREKNSATGFWEYSHINPNEMLKDLFSVWGFSQLEGDIKEQIFELENHNLLSGVKRFDSKDRTFFQSFVYIFNLILTLRNSFSKKIVTNKETGEVVEVGNNIDFISSPVEPFFSTHALDEKGNDISVLNLADLENKITGDNKDKIKKEFNGDANGAYNIARKGLIMLNRISENPEKLDLYISTNDWDKFTQEGEGEAIAKVIKGEKELVEGKGVKGDLTVLAKKHK